MYRTVTPLTHCLLCGLEKPLLKSHVVPKFFRRWLAKELGEQPRFFNPSTRVDRLHDDLSKHALCCAECEAVMGRDESAAREHILEEWRQAGAHRSAYGPWLGRFAAAIAAKATGVLLHSRPTSKTIADGQLPFNRLMNETLPEDERSRLAKALATWRRYTLGEISNPGGNELHLVGFTAEGMPGLIGLFGHTHIRVDTDSAVLIFVGGLVIVALVQPGSSFVRRATRIAGKGGLVGPENYHLTPALAEVLQMLSDANLETQS